MMTKLPPQLGLNFADLLMNNTVWVWNDMRTFALNWSPIVTRWQVQSCRHMQDRYACSHNVCCDVSRLTKLRLLQAGDYAILQPAVANPMTLFLITSLAMLEAATQKGAQWRRGVVRNIPHNIFTIAAPADHGRLSEAVVVRADTR
jgi:hypothetical protein